MQQRILMSMILGALVGSGACHRAPVLTGAPAVGNGVRFVLKETELEEDNAFVALTCYNDTDYEIVVNRNQIALVGPDGRDYFRRGGRELHRVRPHDRHAVHIGVEGGLGWDKMPGLYLRFDGVWAGDIRIDVPPMVLGKPMGSPGQTRTDFMPPQQNGERGVVARVAAAVRGDDAPARKSSGLEQYRGPRRRIKQEGLKVAAMPLDAKDVSDQVAFIIDELLLTELQQVGFEAIGPDDVNAMLGFEKVKETAGCDDATCIAEIGNALGVPYLAAGNVATLEGSTIVTLKLIDVRATRVLSRSSRIADGGSRVLPRVIAEAVQELVAHSEL